MKAKTIISMTAAACLFGLAVPRFALADYPPYPQNNPQSNHETPPQPGYSGAPAGLSGQNASAGNGYGERARPQPSNRATKLIGMRVTTPSNEVLGTVKDIVFNLPAGRIAYVVIEKSTPAQDTGEYAAVRPESLRPSADTSALTLNTDKERFEQSRGFSPANYPKVRGAGHAAQPLEEEDIFIVTPNPNQSSPQK